MPLTWKLYKVKHDNMYIYGLFHISDTIVDCIHLCISLELAPLDSYYYHLMWLVCKISAWHIQKKRKLYIFISATRLYGSLQSRACHMRGKLQIVYTLYSQYSKLMYEYWQFELKLVNGAIHFCIVNILLH